jgi:AbrB family looped-hinge helix DNA binding protein
MYSGGDLMSAKEREKNGVIKKIDNLGRITVPKAWRQYLGINPGAELNIYMIDDETIGIKVVEESTL